nr:hypothetical protein [Herbiconiux ginsengi]
MQIGATILDVLSDARDDRSQQREDGREDVFAIILGGGCRRESLLDRRLELPVLNHNHQFGVGRGIEKKRSDRDIGPVGDLLGRDAADAVGGEQLPGGDHDALSLVFLARFRRPCSPCSSRMGTSVDKLTELPHN